MTEHVVVAVDGGPASAAAFDWVVDRARTVEMRLEITTVVDINWFPQPNPDPVLAEYGSEAGVREADVRIRWLQPSRNPGRRPPQWRLGTTCVGAANARQRVSVNQRPT